MKISRQAQGQKDEKSVPFCKSEVRVPFCIHFSFIPFSKLKQNEMENDLKMSKKWTKNANCDSVCERPYFLTVSKSACQSRGVLIGVLRPSCSTLALGIVCKGSNSKLFLFLFVPSTSSTPSDPRPRPFLMLSDH
jgi:hypothetical protein